MAYFLYNLINSFENVTATAYACYLCVCPSESLVFCFPFLFFTLYVSGQQTLTFLHFCCWAARLCSLDVSTLQVLFECSSLARDIVSLGLCFMGTGNECAFCSCWVEFSANIYLIMLVDGVEPYSLADFFFLILSIVVRYHNFCLSGWWRCLSFHSLELHFPEFQ